MSVRINFILGPAFSGKSEFLIKCLDPEKDTVFFGTLPPEQPAFQKRIDKLKTLRLEKNPKGWTSSDVTDLPKAVKNSEHPQVTAIDCTYSWLSNLVFQHSTEAKQSPEQIQQIIFHECQLLVKAIESKASGDVYIVSSEIGGALASSNPYERLLREVNGRLNQQIAFLSDTQILLSAGTPVRIK